MQKAVELKVKGLTLRGMLHVPEQKRKKFPFVAMYHGFTGDKMEEAFKFVECSRILAKAGIGSVRFDFGGSGESDGLFENMTLLSEIDEARAIYTYMSKLSCADPANLFIMGHSLGGFISSIIAPDAPRLKGAVLWAPAIREGIEYIGNLWKTKPRDKNNSIDLDGLRLGRGYYDSRITFLKLYGNPFRKAAEFAGQVLIIHGAKDETVPVTTGKELKKWYGRPTALLKIIKGADHGFSRLQWKEALIETTVA